MFRVKGRRQRKERSHAPCGKDLAFVFDATTSILKTTPTRSHFPCPDIVAKSLLNLPTSRELEALQRALIGETTFCTSPLGSRLISYADWTASGRSVAFIEDYIRSNVLPLYANTHTDSSATGRHTTQLRQHAREIIRDALPLNGEFTQVERLKTKVIFCGSGTTAAVNKLVGLLNLHNAVVFIGPYEHHSNELPWRESPAEVVVIPENQQGGIDLDMLRDRLKQHAAKGRSLIGSFSAASNVTGVLTDTKQVASILKSHGAVTMFDYAALGPHQLPDMNNVDAVFLSTHKYVGGPSTPGILMLRDHLLQQLQPKPTTPGGGTVIFVTESSQAYSHDVIEREEGGTPDIIGSIRAGMVFDLQQTIGLDLIHQRERIFTERAIKAWETEPSIKLLGPTNPTRASILSFTIVPSGCQQLHYNFVVAVLSDFFGIQVRGGCACAHPYGLRLLQIDVETQNTLVDLAAAGFHGLKPGWTRLSFCYTDSLEKVDFIVEAVRFVGRSGQHLLSLYDFDFASGHWRLNAERLSGCRPSFSDSANAHDVDRPMLYASYLDDARSVALGNTTSTIGHARFADPTLEAMRWFMLPPDYR